ncbi:hypothetical protein D3C72_1675870 [compost metagenome]
MVVVAVGAVHMPLGHHGDGHGAPGAWGCGVCCCVAVIVIVVVVVIVVVIVPMVMSVIMPTMVVVRATVSRRIGPAFGFKGQVLLGHDQVHRAQHVG